MKEQTATSPTRLPPAVGGPGSRSLTPAKTAMLGPLSPSGRSSQRKPQHHSMPPPSYVLLASRSPPSSPHASVRRTEATENIETYALRIHDAMKAKRKARRFPALPPVNNNQTPRTKKQKKKKGKLNREEQEVNAGVYVLENRKTGHAFVGTTWDLHHASAQSFAELRDGVHAHQALSKSFQLYDHEASGITFRVLERVALPIHRKATSETEPIWDKRKNKPAFDVRTMETLLRRRQRFHQRQLVGSRARALVQRQLVLPWLAHYFPVWQRHALTEPRELERFAAAVVVQSVARMALAKAFVARRRRDRAAQRIRRFLAVCAWQCVLQRRCQRRKRHASAMRIQHSVRRFLQQRRRTRRRQAMRNWLAARTIQRVFRGDCGRCAVRQMRELKRRHDGAVALQAAARGFLVRCRRNRERHAAWKSAHATRIQACWRGFATRQFVVQPLAWSQRQQQAAVRLQIFYRHYGGGHRLTHAAAQHGKEVEHATRIHAAYKHYLAKKFGWAAMSYQLEHTSALRIQRAIMRWFFFARLARLVELHRRDRAARTLQRVARGAHGRRVAQAQREAVTKEKAATTLQRCWRRGQARTKLQAALVCWRRDTSARMIQARYRGFHCRREYLVRRDAARRERAVTRIQSTFRRHVARRAWHRRLQLQRDGLACNDCGNEVAVFFSLPFSMQLCGTCVDRWHPQGHLATQDVVALPLYRQQQRLAIAAQHAYRRFQVGAARRFGTCGFCEQRAVRIACRACPHTRTFCHTCDALFHRTTKPHLDRVRIETHLRQHEAARLLQAHVRRYAHRHTIATLRHGRQSSAAVRIQRRYVARRQRRQTRAVVARRHHAACLLQRRIRVFLARCELQRLKRRHQQAIIIQRVVRGYHARREAKWCRVQRDAAVCLQRHVRGMQGRHRADERRQSVERTRRHAAAVALQRHVRGWLMRRRLWHSRRAHAALVIQSGWRRHRAQHVLRTLVHDRDERRRREAEAREQERVARQQEAERLAATRLQCAWRRHDAQCQLARLRVALARRTRQLQLSTWLRVEHLAAVCIQRFVRRQWLTRVARASLLLQCLARQWLARHELSRLRKTKRAAISIQRAFRYARAKRKLTQLVSLESVAVAGTVHGWVELFDEESGAVYYYNRDTHASQWVKPAEMVGETFETTWQQQETETESEVPEWVEYWDDNVGASYFYNTRTGEATWATPEGVTSNQWEDEGGVWPPGAPFDGKAKDDAAFYASNQVAEYGDANGYAYVDYGGAATPGADGYDESLVDTAYELNYEIYMTQLQREAEQQRDQQDQ